MAKLETVSIQKIGRLKKGEARAHQAKQVVHGSIAANNEKSFMSDIKDISGGNLHVAAQMFELGANTYFRRVAALGDEAAKAARILERMGLSGGLSTKELAERLREGKHLD